MKTRNPWRKSFFTLAVALCCAVPLSAFADKDLKNDLFSLHAEVLQPSDTRNYYELELQFEDLNAVANACDYIVKDFMYSTLGGHFVLLFVERENCKTDKFGKGQGVVHWRLPQNLIQSSDINVYLARWGMTDLGKMGIVKIVKGQTE